jgi:hypothetical protein
MSMCVESFWLVCLTSEYNGDQVAVCCRLRVVKGPRANGTAALRIIGSSKISVHSGREPNAEDEMVW